MTYGTAKIDNLVNSSGSTIDLTTITTSEATTSAKGYMSAADKTKLDGIEAGAEVNQLQRSGTTLSPATSGDSLALGTGDLSATKGTFSTGVLFGSDTATANTLNDYEEGTWTPTIGQTTTEPTNIVYDYQRGVYTKVGNLVTVWFDFNLTSFTPGNGRYRVGSLPFSARSGEFGGGYGSPNFRACSAFESGAKLNSTSAFHSDSYIHLRHISDSGTEVNTSVSAGRITGMSFYYTDS
mgnify:CR=1 FL=1